MHFRILQFKDDSTVTHNKLTRSNTFHETVAHMYVDLGCLFHIAKVPSAKNCYILNLF